MNLYKLHDKPETLDHHDKANKVPVVVWDGLKRLPTSNARQNSNRHRKVLLRDPMTAFEYVRLHGFQRIPAAESIIATDSKAAMNYANYVLRRRWTDDDVDPATAKKAEATIANSADALTYARTWVRARWPEAEASIAKSGPDSYDYAKSVLRARFPAGEAAIKADKLLWRNYKKRFSIKDDK